MFKYTPNPPRFARPIIRDDEVRVQNGLAFDLSQMDDLVRRGIPISAQTLAESFYDGEPSGERDNFNIPYERSRHVDMNDAWNRSKAANKAISKAELKLTDANPK